MDKKKILDDLQSKYNELEKEYKIAREDVMNFEGDEEYNEYMELTDEERKAKFPIQYAMFEKKAEVGGKLEALEQEIINAAKEVVKELDERAAKLQDEVNHALDVREQLANETAEINSELKPLKASEGYKNGEESVLNQAKELEAKLKKNRASKGKLTKTINSLTKEIEEIKEQKEELINEYGEEVANYEKVEIPVQSNAEQEEIVPEEEEKQIETEQQEAQQIIEEKQKEIKQIDDQIKSLQDEVPALTEKYNAMMQEIRAQDEEILALKESEEYKRGDEETLRKVEGLEKTKQEKINDKNWIVARLSAIRKVVPALEDKKRKIIEQYGAETLNYTEDIPSEPIVNNVAEQVVSQEDKKGEKNKVKPASRVVYVKDNNEVKDEQLSEPETEKQDDKLKQEFKELYSKAKSGDLTEQEFNELARIMQDVNNYDKLGITTGIVFNKSKVILKAMARMAADTKKTARLSRDELGIKVENATEENGYLATSEIKEWKGLKTLIKNPNKKIASEEVFKQVVAMDRASLTDEQKLIWDEAQAHLDKFSQLRGCMEAYENVSAKRRENRWAWIYVNNEDVKPLPAAETKDSKSGKGLGEELSGLVYGDKDSGEVKARATSVEEKNRDGR